jgi:uncharacterized protein GlcG (DUF336 family)
MMRNKILSGVVCGFLVAAAPSAWSACSDVSFDALTNAATTAATIDTGGYGLPMWVTMVDETGKVCWVTTNGTPRAAAGNSEWLGSRVISAQKANTANAFSLDGYAISTANLYAPNQPNGGSLFALPFSNPVDASVAYQGNPNQYGTKNDPLKNKRIGGVNVFGGGLALYKGGKKIGAIGVSGDTSCRDHAFAWQVRTALDMKALGTGITTVNMDFAGNKVTPLTGASQGDEMILSPGFNDASVGYWSFWAQPYCPNSIPAATAANGTLIAK